MSEFLLEAGQHGLARLEHQLEELCLVILGVVREEEVGKDLVVGLGELVEVHGFPRTDRV